MAAKAAIVGIAAVGSAAAGAAAGILKLSVSAGNAADTVNTLSAKTGLTAKQVQELQYAAQFVHVDVDTMTSSMSKLTKALDMARSGNATTTAAFKELGVAYQDASGNLRNANQWIYPAHLLFHLMVKKIIMI